MRIANFFAFLLIVILLPMTSFAEKSEYGRPPTPEEVVGFWKMVPVPKEMQKVNPWPLPYQWFGFYKNGRLVSMATSEDSDLSAKELEEIFANASQGAPRYSWKDDFLIVDYGFEKELWGMNLFSKDFKFIMSGDLMMSLAGEEDLKPVYYRLLRRVK